MKEGGLPARVRRVGTAALLLVVGPVFAGHNRGVENRPFDFSDAFYVENGIDPSRIVNRVTPGDPCCVDDVTADPEHASPRILLTTGGYDASGNNLYYHITGMVMPDTFTPDDAGRQAIAIASKYRAFIFPKLAGDPLSPAEPNRRQDNVFDTREGYFSNNPLGLWILTFVSWNGPNVRGKTCRDMMAKLARDNGPDLDGTPQIRTASDVDNLAAKGCVTLRTRSLDGSQGFPWVI